MQRLARASLFWLPLVCVAALGYPTTVRALLYRQFYPLVVVEASQLAGPPEALRPLGYVQDDPNDLPAFRALAQSAARTATTDGERLRRLGDMLFELRHPNLPWIAGGREQGVQAILEKMQRGEPGLCGHNTLVLAALWRSLDRDFREVRFTSSDDSAWYAAHYGIEVYAPESRRWIYYDVGLNGYAVDEAGEPLSLAALNDRLASGSDVGIVASPQYHDWDTTQFLSFLREHQLQVFSLNNRLRGLDPDRRFGRLHFAYALFSKLPRPLDRVVDTVTGDSGPRMVLSRRPSPPAAQARLHLTASPRG